MNEPLDPQPDPVLEDRLRAHFADRAANEPLPGGPGSLPAVRPPRAWWQRPTFLAAAAAVLVVAGVAAGLALAGDDDQEDLEIIGPSRTTTTPAPTTTTTGPPATTITTTTTPGSNPAADVRSIIVSADGVLGWWDGSRFVGPQDGLPIPAQGGETYVIVGVARTPTTAVGSAPGRGCEIPDQQQTVDVGLEYPGGRLEPAPIAVSGVPDPAPRAVTVLGSQPAYVASAAQALADLGVDDPTPELAQVLRTDFEGDGVDEVLIVAESLSDPETLFASTGDYSVLLLRQVIDEQVVTTVVAASVADPGPDETPYVEVTRVAAAADLDGDGTMELVTVGFNYEGVQTVARRVVQPGVVQVLAAYCGA